MLLIIYCGKLKQTLEHHLCPNSVNLMVVGLEPTTLPSSLTTKPSVSIQSTTSQQTLDFKCSCRNRKSSALFLPRATICLSCDFGLQVRNSFCLVERPPTDGRSWIWWLTNFRSRRRNLRFTVRPLLWLTGQERWRKPQTRKEIEPRNCTMHKDVLLNLYQTERRLKYYIKYFIARRICHV